MSQVCHSAARTVPRALSYEYSMGTSVMELTSEWAIFTVRVFLVVTYCNHRHENFAVPLIPARGTLYA